MTFDGGDIDTRYHDGACIALTERQDAFEHLLVLAFLYIRNLECLFELAGGYIFLLLGYYLVDNHRRFHHSPG